MTDTPMADVSVRLDESAHRFEILADGRVAGLLTYRPGARAWSLLHTEVDDRFAGHGLGSRLIGNALDLLSERGLGVLPYCPFVRRFIQTHPEYLDLVPAGRRAGFDLPAGDG
jgi:hypothetical protein